MKNKLFCIAVSDLHGKPDRYKKLFNIIEREIPDAVFIAGDLSAGYYRIRLGEDPEDFVLKFMRDKLLSIKKNLSQKYPDIFVICGNDDPRLLETGMQKLAEEGLWHYIHNRRLSWKNFYVSGYSYVPPTPFQLKDWEKYDVSRYVDVGAIAPNAGFRTVPADPLKIEWGTIKQDLEILYDNNELSKDICIFHSPPYKTNLDRAALDGKMVDHAPIDVHVGSIAIREFIQKKQPLLTLHGHVHESTDITKKWRENIENTIMFNCAHNGHELSVIRFDPNDPEKAKRSLI